jgi:hypothetical protein
MKANVSPHDTGTRGNRLLVPADPVRARGHDVTLDAVPGNHAGRSRR